MASSSAQRPPPLQRVQAPPLELGLGKPSPSDHLSVDDRVALLLRAAHDGDIPKIKKLVKRLKEHTGMSVAEAVEGVQAPWGKNHGPLHMAASAGKVKACKFLIEVLELNVNATGTDGATPLGFAVHSSGSLDVVKLLLDHKADPNRAGSGSSPLHIATIRGIYEMAEELLSRGAHVNAIWESKTPLYIASQHGDTRMMELLLNHKANASRFPSAYYVLLKRNLDKVVKPEMIFLPNDLVCTPLKAAVFASSLLGVELLIQAGARVNMGFPETPLIAAAAAGLAHFVKYLLKAGADANIPDDDGRTAVEIAAIHGWQDCVEVLLPVTTPLARVADWSIDGIIQHAKLMISDSRDHVLYEADESDYEAEGDATFYKRDYWHALTLYTMAMEIDPGNSTLYAKRCLCFLHTGYKIKALEDASTYNDMQPDLSKSCYQQEAALYLLKEYGKACESLLLRLNLDFFKQTN